MTRANEGALTASQSELIDQLDDALRTGRGARPPSSLTLADGYAIQDAWAGRRRMHGERQVGYKIGLTTPAARAPWDAHEPGRGILFDSSLLTSPAHVSGTGLPLAFEVELAIELGDTVTESDDADSLLQKVRASGPAFELVSSRWQGGAPNIGAWAADDGMASAVVTSLTDGNDIPNTLSATSEASAMGREDKVSGTRTRRDALDSVLWLARQRIHYPGVRLDAGTLVLTGSIIGPVPLEVGSTRVTAALAGFDPITMTVDRHARTQ